MSMATAAAEQGRPSFVDLECHVLPLLDALVWMGAASNKLAEIDAVKGAAPSLRWIDEINGPDGLNAGALMSSVAWVAASLLQTYQMEQHGTAEGGAA